MAWTMKALGRSAAVAFVLLGAGRMDAQPAGSSARQPIVWLEQGNKWGKREREEFYSVDQGSRIMPLSWFGALRRRDGSVFTGGGMLRYGYLANPASADGLPVGFTVESTLPARTIGMTCAACHTREIEVDGTLYRADGGPAIADFQAFLTDLDVAVGDVVADPAKFDAFAADVRAADGAIADRARLRADVALWYRRYHTLIERALPSGGWGVGRLDAVSMIFNRLTGLDLGPAPDHLIPGNIARADSPVRYPFIWNATRQDHTQWPGFAANGDQLLGLARNLGEVYGVFGKFEPHDHSGHLLGYDFVRDNSANFRGLRRLEVLVGRMGDPKWPWPTSAALVAQGKRIYERATPDGGCTECHGVRRGAVRLVPLSQTWATPRLDVGTDTREYQVLSRVALTGVLTGARKPSLGRLKPVDRSIDILATSVVGAILQHDFPVVTGGGSLAHAASAASRLSERELAHAFEAPVQPAAGPFRYEARVLRGIWATAPYLHNGSVPTLAELLKPPAQRIVQFSVGRKYDRENVGLAVDQTGLWQSRATTGCERLNSGNSRCGHDFGTRLSPADKRALLEYLKVL